MKERSYTFVSTWFFSEPVKVIWDHLLVIEKWPEWWKGVHHSKIISHQGESGGVGSVVETAWKSWLPYTLHFTLTVIEADPKAMRLVAIAKGDLNGKGVWEFSKEDNGTRLTYTWNVTTSKPWMNLVGPLARPIFAHAHDHVMRSGEAGLRKLLEAETK